MTVVVLVVVVVVALAFSLILGTIADDTNDLGIDACRLMAGLRCSLPTCLFLALIQHFCNGAHLQTCPSVHESCCL